MKITLRKLVLIGMMMASARAFGGTPVAVSLFGTLPERADVYGLHFSIVCMGQLAVTQTPSRVCRLDASRLVSATVQ